PHRLDGALVPPVEVRVRAEGAPDHVKEWWRRQLGQPVERRVRLHLRGGRDPQVGLDQLPCRPLVRVHRGGRGRRPLRARRRGQPASRIVPPRGGRHAGRDGHRGHDSRPRCPPGGHEAAPPRQSRPGPCRTNGHRWHGSLDWPPPAAQPTTGIHRTAHATLRHLPTPLSAPLPAGGSAAARWRSAGRATVMGVSGGEERDGVPLTNLDQPLFDGARATKRDLVDYLDAVSGHLLPELSGRPLTVVRVLRGQSPFMQKNLPRYAPDWVRRVRVWAESSQREVTYPVCDDRRTLLWFANQ